ncbi:histidine-type phosphatase [Vibrio zhugei]|uniref:Histidine-type phosphatase n=1 Tax=Vibrio zhugei TaxID=2479546 RepID=A0ABV7CDJ2_9VIBR|nr:histidine-type phosphatase [Vibrio zhugei]
MWYLTKQSLIVIFVSMASVACSVQASDYTLDKVVTVTRHGVRPQTNSEKLDKGTGKVWPRFTVADGHLTGHGYTGMWQQGRYQLAEWKRQGLALATDCASAHENVFLWTSPKQRIKATGKAMADGMFPGCGIAPLSVDAEYGPLFELYHLHAAHMDKDIMRQQIMARMISPQHARERYHDAVTLLRSTVCAPDECRFLDQPWGVAFKSTGKPMLTGPGKLGATIGETIRLQYSDNLPLDKVAFGHASDADAVKALMAIHAAQYNYALNTLEFASHSGSLLMRQVLSALTSGTALQAQWPGDTRLRHRLVMLVGHDSNIAELQTLLGFSWTLAGYPSNDIPPGGTLSFARFHQANSTQPWVRVRFSARSLDQWRNLTTLDHQHPLLHVDLHLPGCRNTDVGTLCPLDTVVKKASQHLVKDGMALPVFKS